MSIQCQYHFQFHCQLKNIKRCLPLTLQSTFRSEYHRNFTHWEISILFFTVQSLQHFFGKYSCFDILACMFLLLDQVLCSLKKRIKQESANPWQFILYIRFNNQNQTEVCSFKYTLTQNLLRQHCLKIYCVYT